ncbi:family 78 glycoside hydrolase catalytic domain [Mucilaginibacter segetis]|uniref:alpha-L-rhamnosidase n=1 Tax=Mucilaginibacter segetis TaxID=2793071 RepID=A0A934UMS2_9SPHI|nr:family 78 glycoside hydrolase catalytic domain [Mucilaginibacter segetis]MBK0379315.1 family 78 glycoside hydrolase catalytic domain [Mucilaginibacter segetis]
MNKLVVCIGMILFGLSAFGQPISLRKAYWINAEASVPNQVIIFQKVVSAVKPVRSGTLLVTVQGLYEASLNGKKIGDTYLRPGFTSYGRRLQYDSLDVTSMLTKENRLEVLIGRGWYSGMFGRQVDNFGSDISLLCALVITYRDGSRDTIASDWSWKYAVSPLQSSMYDGEFLDTRSVSTDFKPVVVAALNKGNLVPAGIPPVRAHEQFKGKFLGERLFDFHQNLAGFVRLRIKGQPGDTLRIRHGEVLDRSGQLYMGNLREAKATDTYILNGQAQVLAPHFTYHGFRYAQVEWKRGNKMLDVSGLGLMAVALYSDLPVTGSFSCSNAKLNQLQHNIEWSMKSNILDIPTDCPQRSERLGWTQDADAFCATASYLMDVKDFYRKWLRDLATDQNSDGSVPVTIPYVNYMKRDFVAAGWSDAAVWTPWTLYERYGDTGILKEQYKSMKAWVDYVTRHDGHIGGFGDWYAAGPETDINYIDLCCWYRSAVILQKTARLLGYPSNDELSAKIKAVFEKTFGDHMPQTQTAYVLGIYTGLLPGSDAGKLAELVKANHNHLATGFLGTPHLLEVLSANGYTDLAYQVLLQEDVPSWLYMVDRGATTLWEKWDAIRPDGSIQPASLNHYSFGSVGQWLYENIAGIRPLSPGYQKILIAPKPGGGLTWAKGSLKTAYGTIVSNWKIRGGKYHFDIQIPDSCTATIRLPHQPDREVRGGHYQFTSNQL